MPAEMLPGGCPRGCVTATVSLCPQTLTRWLLPSPLCVSCPRTPFAFSARQIEFLNAFFFFFLCLLSLSLNPELERQEKPVLGAAAAIPPRQRETWHGHRAGARGATPESPLVTPGLWQRWSGGLRALRFNLGVSLVTVRGQGGGE